ncbi:MAG: prephenate dehydrogenase [Oscillospiraceae bacterium]|nr:prephenate dehydrogenase [Oscillospiraceae bacterium]MBR7085238.1 prephenate dehydrogenase [Oscillospiraceae bacterium]
MKILVAGLGLIGGSICKAIHAYTDHAVYGWNRTKAVSEKALSEHAIDGIAGEDCSEFDMILVSLYPELTKKWVRNHVASMHKGAIVLDVSGVKTTLPQEMTALCETYGIHYLSTHPMAGKERAGFDVSDENLFQGANFIMTPLPETPKSVIAQVQNFAHQIGFRKFVITTPEMHDKMIAYTSQLAHVVSSSYVQSPEIQFESGFSGGSFQDMTRIATMNEEMWTELFMENQESLLQELNILISHLQDYQKALADKDRDAVYALIRDGRLRKEQNLKNRRHSPAVIDLTKKEDTV